MVGGRNIGDKYFLRSYKGELVHDRDIVIINTDTDKPFDSVINDMKAYFNMLWDQFSKYPAKRLRFDQPKRSSEREEYFRELLEEAKNSHPEIFNHTIDWYDLSVPSNRITLIHNPIMRLNKETWILMQSMGYGADSKIDIHSKPLCYSNEADDQSHFTRGDLI